MRHLLPFVTLLTVAPAIRAHNSKGQKDPEEEKQNRLIGASESPAWGHPYTVYFMEGDFYHGSGVILDPYTILADGRSSHFGRAVLDDKLKANILVFAGKFAQWKYEPEEQWREICSYVRHPDYNDQTKINSYAIISLFEPFTMNQYVNTIPLAPRDFVQTLPCVVVARGHSNTKADGVKCLRQVVVERKDCPSPHQSLVCTGRGQCHNDDGGALICQHGSRAVLAGLVTAQSGACDARKHSIYANIAAMPRSWLSQEVEKAKKICRPSTF